MTLIPRWSFGTQVCGTLSAGASREWLVTDGRGGYAMGTVAGLRTRRYHGLLVVAGATPARRMLGLAALDAIVTLPSGAQVRLGTHEWASGHVEPRGYTLLESFELRGGVPRWRWRIGDLVLEREIAMEYGRASVAVTHRLVAGPPVRVTVEALGTWRDSHGERHATGDELTLEPTGDGVLVAGAYRVAGPGYEPDGHWWLGVRAREEAERGLHPDEDLRCLGRFGADLEPGGTLAVSAWAGDLATAPPPAATVIAAARSRAADVVAGAADETAAALALAADAFVIATDAGPDVVAGYPWFGAWSRDTMTSYEGLFLTTGRAELGRELLVSYAGTLSEGMLANTADTGATEYNTADATLWFLHAVDRHVAATGDTDLAASIVDGLDGIVTAHLAGTRFGIRIDPTDGLLTQGAEGKALTWMDAVVGGIAATPRPGKAVEINALWINGLAALAGLRERLGRPADDLRKVRELALDSFRARFPDPAGWLRDVVDSTALQTYPRGDDPALRPNQLLAYGLPYAPMRGTDPGPVRAVGAALLTPLGLRTLATGENGYRGAHRGSPVARDHAYHQGTVWPWLIGPYVDACRAVGLDPAGALDGLIAHLPDWGVGSVSETADGDAPHTATGCPFQAWSVAELARSHQIPEAK
ncbi:amylo-alpha-1,6-glucosidase [Luedemannella helvata]|uniref:Amylo-alpha-1,6-glucosidase n=1 Tax=Luedemannella helvata TaxID=349315 RepID=A0ABN2L3R5_9ACTN